VLPEVVDIPRLVLHMVWASGWGQQGRGGGTDLVGYVCEGVCEGVYVCMCACVYVSISMSKPLL